MTRKALVIGIDEYPSPHELGGCVNDAVQIAALLRKNGDGSPNFEVKLITAGDDDASTVAIDEAVRSLFSGEAETAVRGQAALGVGRMNGTLEANGGADGALVAETVRECIALIAIESKKSESGVSKGDGDSRAEPASQLGSWRPRRWNGFPFGRARQS